MNKTEKKSAEAVAERDFNAVSMSKEDAEEVLNILANERDCLNMSLNGNDEFVAKATRRTATHRIERLRNAKVLVYEAIAKMERDQNA